MSDKWSPESLNVVIRQASISEIIDLRNATIIAGTDRTSPEFAGDHEDTTRHFGAFEEDRAVCCATFLLSEWETEPAWQLRGMATTPQLRGKGIGSALLRFAEQALREAAPVRRMWCNARTGAVTFYERHGWRTVSDEFLIQGVGPHYRMVKNL